MQSFLNLMAMVWNLMDIVWNGFWLNIQGISSFATIVGICVAYRAYKSDVNARRDKDRPWVFIDIDISNFSICNLVLKNIGEAPAKDIETVFIPDIAITSSRTINNMGIIKHLPFLSPARNISFFFGTFMDEKILKPFNVTIKYKDIYGRKFTSNQIVDPSSYLGMIRADGKGVSHIAESLKKMEKPLETLAKVSERQLESWKKGLLIRNMKFSTMTLSEKLELLAKIYNNGQKDETWLNPFVFDLQLLFKEVRDEIAAKQGKTDTDNKRIELLNELFANMFDLGPNTEFYERYKQLAEIATTESNISTNSKPNDSKLE